MEVGPVASADPTTDEPPEEGGHDGGSRVGAWLAAAVVVAAIGAVAVTALGSDDRVVTLASGWMVEQPPEVPTAPPTTRWALEFDPAERLDAVEVVDDHVVAIVTEMTEDLTANTTRVLALDQANGDRVWTHELEWDVPRAMRDQGGSSSQWGPPMVHVLADDEVISLTDGAPGWLPELALEAASGQPAWERPPMAVADLPSRTSRRAHPPGRRSVTTTFGDTPGPSEVVDLDTGEVVFRSDGVAHLLGGDTWLSQTLDEDRPAFTLRDPDGTPRTRLSIEAGVSTMSIIGDDGSGAEPGFLVVGTRDELQARDFDGGELWSLPLADVDATGSQANVWQLGDGRALVAMVEWRDEPEIRHVVMATRDGATALADSGLVDVPGVTEHPAVLGFGEPRLLCSQRSSNETGCPAELALLSVDGQVRATSDEPVEAFLGGPSRTEGHATQAGTLRLERPRDDRQLVLRDWQTLDATWRLDISTLGWTPDLLVSTSERGIALGSSRPGTESGPVVTWAS